jgi:NADH:ubiquinone oxidoreductase subunit 4 (subunit M)
MADAFDLVFLILFIACGYFVWRKYSKVTAIYYVSMLSLYLVRFAGSQPLLGTARYVLMLFPAFFVLAEWGRRPWANRLILYSSFAGLLFLSGQFAIWGWVG